MNRIIFGIVGFALAMALGACGSGRNVGSGSFDGGPTTEDGSGAIDGGPTTEDGEESFTLSGAVQKGPLVLGSAVSVSPLDKDGVPTGEVFQTQSIRQAGLRSRRP
jgi:hypothetical protein